MPYLVACTLTINCSGAQALDFIWLMGNEWTGGGGWGVASVGLLQVRGWGLCLFHAARFCTEVPWWGLSKRGALTSTETVRVIRDGEKGGWGDIEVGEQGDYIPIATLSQPE